MGTSQCNTDRGSHGWWPVQSTAALVCQHPASSHVGNHYLGVCMGVCVGGGGAEEGGEGGKGGVCV